jgi:acyl-CoA thioester hydrolase
LSPERVFRNREEGYGLPVVGAQCDFFKPVRYGETLSLQVRVVRWGSKSATFGFRFYNGAGELAADGRATLAAIDRNWRSRPWPAALRKALEAFSTEV